MDFTKIIDQTVREIKREVNLKVLNVPEIEQKVLDATDGEPWGPHGSAFAEITQATKKLLSETGRNWRYVYKTLAVIEYLVANGSECAVDDIVEHTYQISSLASFEYVEPSGKDLGINVRKKAGKIVSLLNNKDKIQEVRNKASTNRDKYFGLSSSGITYKSGAASFSSSSFQSSDRFGGVGGTKDNDTFKGTFKDKDQASEGQFDLSTSTKSNRAVTNENQGNISKKKSTRCGSKGQDTSTSVASRPATAINISDKYSSAATQSSSAPSNNYEDDFDDFDPRGTSSTKSSANTNQVDLFGQSLVHDPLDAPASVPEETSTMNSNSSRVDLFADAAFVSASPHVEAGGGGGGSEQTTVDLFASQPASSSAVSSLIDFFAAPNPIGQPAKDSSKPDKMNTNAVDPFSAVPLNDSDGSDLFGAFTSNNDSLSTEVTKNHDGSHNNLDGTSSAESKPLPKKETFQVKSGIWADSLSRGLIDLNISAPKKVSLADVGIVGGLSDGSDERDKGPPTSFYMERGMGSGPGIGKSGITSSTGTTTTGDDIFSTLLSHQHQFGSFKT